MVYIIKNLNSEIIRCCVLGTIDSINQNNQAHTLEFKYLTFSRFSDRVKLWKAQSRCFHLTFEISPTPGRKVLNKLVCQF